MAYRKFLMTILVSFLIMYGVMFLNVDKTGHIYLNATRLYMSLLMVSLAFLRNQQYIGDRQYMKAMIPHHSSAILTSKHADIRDPEVKQLSKQIIQSQEEEIAQMKKILERMDR